MDSSGVSNCRPSPRLLTPGRRRLAVVLGLPLADGVFITLVLAGVLADPTGIVLTGVVIFGGTAAAAVTLADLEANPRNQLRYVLLLGSVLVPIAGVQAMMAPSVASLIDIGILERFAAIVLAIIGIRMIETRLTRWLPAPGMIVVLGILVSLDPAGSHDLVLEPSLFVAGAASAGIGIAVVAAVVLVGHRLRSLVCPDRMRHAGGVAVLVLATSLVSPLPTTAALAALVLGITYAGEWPTTVKSLGEPVGN